MSEGPVKLEGTKHVHSFEMGEQFLSQFLWRDQLIVCTTNGTYAYKDEVWTKLIPDPSGQVATWFGETMARDFE